MWKQRALNVILGILILVSVIGRSPMALASIHSYPETPTQTMYRSRLSVQDTQRQAWQLILFKRIQFGQVTDFKLRLIGFPGQVLIQHPAPLGLEDSHGRHWEIVDQTQNDPQLESVQSSVGQYNFIDMMKTLEKPERLELTLTLVDEKPRTVIVPQSMVREWLELKDISD